MTDLNLGTSSSVIYGNPQLQSIWRDEALVDRLRELHGRKPEMSMGAIAAVLSQEYRIHITRNAVISKVNRIGLTRGQRSIVTRESGDAAPRKTYTRKVVSEPSLIGPTPFRARSADVEPLHAPLHELSAGQCRFAYGDGPFTFCGCPSIPGLSYCEPHHRLTHTNAVMTRDERAILKDQYKEKLKAAVHIQREGVACL